MRISDWSSDVCSCDLLQAQVAPFDRGVALFLDDMSLTDDLAAARTSADGLAALCEASGRVATGRLTARGLIEGVPDALATLVGVGSDQLRGMRLTSILDLADRPPLNEIGRDRDRARGWQCGLV